MLEDQVAYLLQRYLGNYIRGLSKEALKISVREGNLELRNVQLKPEALNALKLPVKVKAGSIGSVKLKVPWSRLGQDPVIVYLDQIFLLAEPATKVEGSSEDALQEAKKSRIREMETKLLESRQELQSEMNKSWLGSVISKVIGNLKLSISDVHIRYEDLESNPGHPFAAGVTLDKLSAFTVDEDGKEAFVTGGALGRIQKSVELERLSVHLDSDVNPWHVDKSWEDLSPREWKQIFKFGTKDGKPRESYIEEHSYILQPVSGDAKYSKERPDASVRSGQASQKAIVNLDDVTLCLSKNGYRDLLKLADNFASFNQRLKYAHYRPLIPVKSDVKSWWKYAYRAISEQTKKASGKLSWEQVLRYTSLRKKYVSLYVALLKSDPERVIVDDNKDIEELDRELDAELIVQWRMLAHNFVEQSMGSEFNSRKKNEKRSWWSFGWLSQSVKDETEPGALTEEDWERLNNIIGYKGSDAEQFSAMNTKKDVPQLSLEVHMKHNASKLTVAEECLADLSCDNLDCFITLYEEAKWFDVKLGSYRLLSPSGVLAESATSHDSVVATYCYKPFNSNVDWSVVAKASPCYVTYLKDSIDQIMNFFESNTAVSQTIALETAAALQMTIDEVKRTAQLQVNRALKDYPRFLLDLDIAAPKITIPTNFCPDGSHSTKLLLDLGNLLIQRKDDSGYDSPEANMYNQFDLALSDVSAFLVDGEYHWSNASGDLSKSGIMSCLPVINRCGVFLNLQQILSNSPLLPSTRVSVRLPSLGFHFSPARYHRLMQVAKIFQGGNSDTADQIRPWDQADFEGWLLLLTYKGMGGREAVWQRRYICIVGAFIYVLDYPGSRSYKQSFSLRGKQLFQVPSNIVGEVEHVLGICGTKSVSRKIIEGSKALILRCETEDSRKTWQSSLQAAIYHASASTPISGFSESSLDSEESETDNRGKKDSFINVSSLEKIFLTGVLDDLRVCFYYSGQEGEGVSGVLLAEERRLFEFRGTGSRVEFLMKGNDIFIGLVLKTLEIEDLVSHRGKSRRLYVARSFIKSADAPPLLIDTKPQGARSRGSTQSDGEDDFYEAPEDLNDSLDSPHPLSNLPRFSRVPGLLPLGNYGGSDHLDVTDTLDSFVKAQIVIYDQNSPLYTDIAKKIELKLATLTFYCRSPMILAIMKFVNEINTGEEIRESSCDSSSPVGVQHGMLEDTVGEPLGTFEEPTFDSCGAAPEIKESHVSKHETQFSRNRMKIPQRYNNAMEDDQKMSFEGKVYCRLRPLHTGLAEEQTIVRCVRENGHVVVVNPLGKGTGTQRTFKVNKVFDSSANQAAVFGGTWQIVKSVLDGFNVCILAYGQSDSGKSYTMTGPPALSSVEEWGLSHRAFHGLFNFIKARRHMQYEISIQMVEICDEEVFDLLSDDGCQNNDLLFNSSKHQVKEIKDVLELMQNGLSKRAIGTRIQNKRSYRSHSIIIAIVKGTNLETKAISHACMHLVDLAGPEVGLTALGNVCYAVAHKIPQVPYEKSKLTELLRSSLDEKARLLLFLHLNQEADSYRETINTLEFADRVFSIELPPSNNEEESAATKPAKEGSGATEPANEGSGAPSFGNPIRRGQPVDFGPRGSSGFSSPGSQIGGPRPLAHPRSFRGQDARFEDRHLTDNRITSVPLPLPRTDDSITLGPQGGLGRGMSYRGQLSPPPLSNTPGSADTRRMGTALNGYSATPDRGAYGSREDSTPRYMPDRLSSQSIYERTNAQDLKLSYGNNDGRIDDRSLERLKPVSPRDAGPSSQVVPEERLRDMSLSTIREFYSAKDKNEVILCIKDLNARSYHPSMISLWVMDSFERKDLERDLLARLLVDLARSRDQTISNDQLIGGFESVLSTLEDAVNDAPKAAEFLGHLFAHVISENVISLAEIGKLIYEGGEEQGRLVEIGLAAEVLGTIFESINTKKGPSVLGDLRTGANLELKNFRPPGSSKPLRIDKFI